MYVNNHHHCHKHSLLKQHHHYSHNFQIIWSWKVSFIIIILFQVGLTFKLLLEGKLWSRNEMIIIITPKIIILIVYYHRWKSGSLPETLAGKLADQIFQSSSSARDAKKELNSTDANLAPKITPTYILSYSNLDYQQNQ